MKKTKVFVNNVGLIMPLMLTMPCSSLAKSTSEGTNHPGGTGQVSQINAWIIGVASA